MDRISPEQRSRNMQRIRCRDTSPEIAVRQLVRQLGFGSRYRLYNHRLPGRPDLVFPKLRKIIFVHGCFWHSHRGCDLAHAPRSRKGYWDSKLKCNKERDRANLKRLRKDGWQVLVLWECQLSGQQSAAQQVEQFLHGPVGRTDNRRHETYPKLGCRVGRPLLTFSGRVPHSFAFFANEWVLSPSHR